jgi:hypothetical protein
MNYKHMKLSLLKYSGWLSIGVFFLSCQKVIDIDLNSSDPKMVIEAEISDQSFCRVKLSQTVNFDESNTFPAVKGAVIIISDNFGNSELLTEVSEGNYTGTSLQGVSGRIYTMEVTASGKTYTAVSSMPPPVNIDTLVAETSVAHGPMSGKTYVNVKYQDPAEMNNYYRFIQIINGVPENDIFISEDRLQDGQIITTPIFNPNSNSNLYPGDTVTIQLLTIDVKVYDYFRTLLETMGGGRASSAALPANPLTNFNNGALGYFSAHSIRTKSIIIK